MSNTKNKIDYVNITNDLNHKLKNNQIDTTGRIDEKIEINRLNFIVNYIYDDEPEATENSDNFIFIKTLNDNEYILKKKKITNTGNTKEYSYYTINISLGTEIFVKYKKIEEELEDLEEEYILYDIIIENDTKKYIYHKKEKFNPEETLHLYNEQSLITDGKININGLNQNINYALNNGVIKISDIDYTDINYYKNKLYFVNYYNSGDTPNAKLYILSISDDKLTYKIEHEIELTLGNVGFNVNVNNIYTFIYNDKLIIVYQDTTQKKSRIELIYDLIENISYTIENPGNITFENSILYSLYIYNNELFGLINKYYSDEEIHIKLIDISYKKIDNNYYFSINKNNYDDEDNNYGTLLPNYEIQDTKYNLCLINNFIYTINQNVLCIYQIDPSTKKLIKDDYEEEVYYYCLTYNNDIVYCLCTTKTKEKCQLIMYDTKTFNPSADETGKTIIDLTENIPFDDTKKYVLYYSKDNYLYLYEINTTKLYSINLNNNNEVITYDIYDEQTQQNVKIKTSVFNNRINYLFLENKQICIYTNTNLSLSPISSIFYNNLNVSSNSITIETVPTNKKDVVNKEYVDNSIDSIDSIKLTINDTPDEDFY